MIAEHALEIITDIFFLLCLNLNLFSFYYNNKHFPTYRGKLMFPVRYDCCIP